MDYLAAMRAFVRVVERGSISAAARDLGLGQPAVSERIARLEAHLCAPLLRRNTRAMSVTDKGAAFYERCKLAIEAADDALAVLHTDRLLSGKLRIAAPHGLGEVLLTPVVLNLRETHPELQIELVFNDRVVDPVTEGVDLSLRLGPVGEGHFIARPLGTVRRVLVAAPAYVERHGRPERPTDLAGHGFARVAGLFPGNRLPLLTPDGGMVSVTMKMAITVSHWRPLHALLLGGGAIGVLQEPVCVGDVEQGKLVPLLPDFTVPPFEFHALFAPGRPTPPRVRLLLSEVEAKANEILTSDGSQSLTLNALGSPK